MRRAFTLTLFVVVFGVGQCWAELLAPDLSAEQTYKVATEMLRRENFPGAAALLPTIKNDSPHFAWAVIEAGKTYYRLERWSEFFGLASYSRNSLPVTEHTERLVLLEILGLLRHCRADEARALVAERLESSGQATKKHFQTLADLLEIAPTAPDSQTGADQTPHNAVKVPRRQLWPIPASRSAKLNPFQMRRRVESVCQKKEGTP